MINPSPVQQSVQTVRPRWLFVDGASQLGGHQIMVLRWLEELQRQQRVDPVLMARHNTSMLSMAEQACHKTKSLSAPPVSRVGRWLLPIRAVQDAFHLAIATIKFRPAVCISVEGCLLSQIWLTVMLRLFCHRTLVYVPLIESSSSMGFGRGPLRDWMVRRLYSRIPHGWITLTQAQAMQFRTWAGIHTPIFDLPNTVTTQIEHAGVVNDRQPVLGLIRVLVLGRFDAHQKGLDSLLDFVETAKTLPNITITVVGGGPYGVIMQQRLAGSVRLQRVMTIQPWSATLDVLKQHDVLLLPSRYEGVPLVMLEAMAVGIPVVASRLPGMQAFLSDSCLFAVGDVAHAMELIVKVNAPSTRNALIERNRQVFQAQASGRAFGSAVAQLTDALLKWPLSMISDASHSPSTDIHWLASPHDGR